MEDRAEIAKAVGLIAVYGMGVVLYMAALEAAQWTFDGSWFDQVGPGVDAPWYFMGRDLIDGLWSAGALVVLLFFTILTAPKLGAIVWAAFGINAISFIARIGPALNVWLHSTRIWDRPEAQTSWMSFDPYKQSQRAVVTASQAVSVVIAACCIIWYARALRRNAAAKSAP